jgi:sialic acid synthase SpsE
MHLRRIPHLTETFDVVPGLFDHTLGAEVPVDEVALGAQFVEKHLTLSREEEGPDSDFWLEPGGFAEMVQAVRKAEKVFGEVR